MQGLPRDRGFTLLELMIVLAIMAVVTAFAVPSFYRYRIAEEARRDAQIVASALRGARERSVREGRSYFVLFNAPASAPGAVARVVQDMDNDLVETAIDVPQDVFFDTPQSPEVAPYGLAPVNPWPNAVRAPFDPSAGLLGTVAAGSSFPVDPVTGAQGLAFTTRGIPVALSSPAAWGSGTGAYYVTDGVRNVYAVEVGPLGEIRVRALEPQTDTWS